METTFFRVVVSQDRDISCPAPLHLVHVPCSNVNVILLTDHTEEKNPQGLASFCYVALVNSSKVWKFGTRMADAVVVAWQCQ